MTVTGLIQLGALIKQQRETLLSRWRGQVRQLPSAQQLDVPTLNDHMPGLLDELAAALESRSDQTIPEALLAESPPAHGLHRLENAFEIDEVVAEYNILRGCLHDLADESGLSLQGRPFHIVNRVLDQAIGLALQTYATQRALEVQARREEYLSFVAHDLRTPLNAIALAGRVLELNLAPNDPGSESARMLRALRRNVVHLEVLVAKVLEENSNLQSEVGVKLVRREFDLWPLVEALVHDLHPVAGTSSTRIVNAVPEDLAVWADASLLRRIFQNLIANAIRHTPRGEVTIEAEERAAEGLVECRVTDNGEGIPGELLTDIFEKGETHSEIEVTGLGLAIVRTFTEAHGGKVSAESREGTGSTFRFTLPDRADADAPKGG